MSEKEVGRPKVSYKNPGRVKENNGPFRQVGEYPSMGGLTASSKWTGSNPSMALEKGGPAAQKGKPI